MTPRCKSTWPNLRTWPRRLVGMVLPVGLLLGIAMCPSAWANMPANTTAPAEAKKSDGKIYKFVKNGTTSFSDVAPSQGGYIIYRTSCFACNVNSHIDWQSTRLHLDVYGDEINVASRQFGLDPALVRAVIHAESGFNAKARSPKGAMGLMQLMPGTARMLGVTDARQPSHNILGGVKYLAGLLQRFKYDVTLATAAYNAGPEAVKKYAGVPPYPETQVYVQRVKILHQRYKMSQLR